MYEQWIDGLWQRIEAKLDKVSDRLGPSFPSQSDRTGKMIEFGSDMGICSWTNGFWPGEMWLAYLATKKEKYKLIASECERKLDKAFEQFVDLNHDVGFMWIPVSVAHDKIEPNEDSKRRALHAATILAGRFNYRAKMIRAWNFDIPNWAIIDCMMNVPLLFWAYENDGKDVRYADIANMHIESVMKHFMRNDGSVNHIVQFDTETGEVTATPAGQGYASGSAWSRGQAWAIYGFVIAYLHTGISEYLELAKRTANYFMMNIDDTGIADVDFKAPRTAELKDSSASAIAACGLIEIAKVVSEYEHDVYLNAALKLLKGIENICDFSTDTDFIVQHCSAKYHGGEYCRDVSLVYGDYFFTEAVLKLKGNEIMFW